MSKLTFTVLAVLLLNPLFSLAENNLGLGVPLTEQQLNPFDITVFPDGHNLPQGQGDAIAGRQLYQTQCQMCHGEKGIEGPAARLSGEDGWFSISDPLRALRIKKYPVLLISVGGLWPHSTSIFDYIRRAMPHYAPKSLSDNDTYALTAYILFLNDLIDETETIDKTSILQVEMPGKKRSIIDTSTQEMLAPITKP